MPFKNVLYVCSMRLPLWEFNLKILHCINIWNDGYQLYHFSLRGIWDFFFSLCIKIDVCPDIRLSSIETIKYVIVMRISSLFEFAFATTNPITDFFFNFLSSMKSSRKRKELWWHLWLLLCIHIYFSRLTYYTNQQEKKTFWKKHQWKSLAC